MSRNKGFSLLELMMVVSIIGIFAGLAIPRLNSKPISRKVRGTIPIGTVQSLTLANVGAVAMNVDVIVRGYNIILGTADGGSSITTASYYDQNIFGLCLYTPAPLVPPFYASCQMTVPYSSNVTCAVSGGNSTCTNTSKTLAVGQGMTLGFGSQHAHVAINGVRNYEYWGWAPQALASRASNHSISYEIIVNDPAGSGRIVGHVQSFEDSGNISSTLPINGGQPF